MLEGFYRYGDGYVATYENINTGATTHVTCKTLERAEILDADLRAEGYAPVIRVPDSETSA